MTEIQWLQLQPGMSPILFWCLLIKVNNFAFDEDDFLWSETTCLDGWVAGRPGGWIFRKYSHLSPQLKLGLGLGLSLAIWKKNWKFGKLEIDNWIIDLT